jgi:alpha-L-rhamnosidase
MWRYHGDTQILSTYYSRMVMFMEWLQSKADNATGLVTHDGLADWCPPASTDTEPAQVSSFSQLMGYGMMAEVAEALGKNDDVARATAMLTRLKLAYNTRYYDANTSLYQDSAPHGGFIKANVQTSNSMALYLGVPATQTQTKQVVASLVHDIVERSHHLSTGIIGTRTLLDTLSMFNQTEVSYKLAVQETYPGHGHFVRQNATTLWERWEATTHDPTGGSSMNHIMYGGQQSFYFTSLIGLRMAEGVRGAGWGSIVVAPHVPTGLAGAALRLDTDRGEITVQWSQGNATAKPATTLFALSVTVPVGTNASLCIPTFDKGLKQVAMSESGNPLFHEGNFVAVAGCTSAAPSALGSICFECGSGSYEIELAH